MRSWIGRRIGVVAVCAVALFGGLQPALRAAEESGRARSFELPSRERSYVHCDDFASRAEAQRFLDRHPTRYLLDYDHDGRACEHFDWSG